MKLTRKQFLVSAGAAAGVAAAVPLDNKLSDGGFAPVSLPGVPKRKAPVLPAGAGSRKAFDLTCVGCQLCVAQCPEQVLRPSTDPARFGRPEMDFRRGHCRIDCVRCGEVCPAGAIVKLTPEEKRNVHLGHAVWKSALCLRNEGESCNACVRHCPVQAVKLVNNLPTIDKRACIGCGACEHYCPVRPLPAIFVSGFEIHREVRPISNADLIAEMKQCLEAGKSCVVAREGVIVAQLEGRGVKPILDYSAQPRALRGALVVDKVMGRAAAAIAIVGGAAKVHARVMSADAKKLLAARGVTATCDELVERILNRDRSGGCPLEAAVETLDEPEKMVEALRALQ